MAASQTILVVNGPNLNMLGHREPATYGRMTLADLERTCHEAAERLGLAVDFRQSNYEGDLVAWIQEARASHAGIIVNAGAYTHTSIALLDALRSAERPAIEVHLSNPQARESFRHTSYVAQAAMGAITGLGAYGYVLALEALRHKLLN